MCLLAQGEKCFYKKTKHLPVVQPCSLLKGYECEDTASPSKGEEDRQRAKLRYPSRQHQFQVSRPSPYSYFVPHLSLSYILGVRLIVKFH